MIDQVEAAYDELEAMVDQSVPASEFVGDPMDENPNQSTTRIYIQNLNGLGWNNDGGKWPYVCEAMEAIQADIMCFSELNTDTNRYNIRTKLESVCRQQFDHNHLVLAMAPNKTATPYKPGGTAIVARNSITSRIKSHTRDRMGRRASISISTSKTGKLQVISAYQVCTIKKCKITISAEELRKHKKTPKLAGNDGSSELASPTAKNDLVEFPNSSVRFLAQKFTNNSHAWWRPWQFISFRAFSSLLRGNRGVFRSSALQDTHPGLCIKGTMFKNFSKPRSRPKRPTPNPNDYVIDHPKAVVLIHNNRGDFRSIVLQEAYSALCIKSSPVIKTKGINQSNKTSNTTRSHLTKLMETDEDPRQPATPGAKSGKLQE